MLNAGFGILSAMRGYIILRGYTTIFMGVFLLACALPVDAGLVITGQDVELVPGETGRVDIMIRSQDGTDLEVLDVFSVEFRITQISGPRPAFPGVDATVNVVGAAPFVEPERRSDGPHYHARSLLQVVPILLRITTWPLWLLPCLASSTSGHRKGAISAAHVAQRCGGRGAASLVQRGSASTSPRRRGKLNGLGKPVEL